jgi:hypothetical protein
LDCTSSSMLMILRFGLLMESVSSCIFCSQLLCCVTKHSSAFSSISIYHQALLFCLPLVLVCWSGLLLCFLFD